MATSTYVALLTTTVGTATPTVSISPIPSGYTDLVVVGSIRSSSSTSVMRYRYNGATTNYSATTMYGVGSGSGGSFRTTGETGIYGVGGSGIYVTNTADTFTTFNLHIFNYANTTTFKTSIVRTGGAASADATVGLWRATPAAITQLDFVLDSGNFAVGSTFTIYGVTAAAPFAAKATGGTITYSVDGYAYHTFTSGGTFTPSVALSCDVLVIGGGGGGGNGGSYSGGGGSAGTVTYASSQNISSAQTVTIGGPGSGGYAGGAGTTSSFGGTSASGGSGGATGSTSGGIGAGGSNSGANGGPGTGAYSSLASMTNSGVGGFYAGGGGAASFGAGGSGGGGAGSGTGTGSAGVSNTGSGGGGGGYTGGPGGSGIVIVRYAK